MTLHVALVHYPTVDKTGQVVCTSVTNLDLHDFSRAGTTYGAAGVWIVHPYEAQQRFLRRVVRHWTAGWGAGYNPTRKESLARTILAYDLQEVGERIQAEEGHAPVFVGTSAKPGGNRTTYTRMRERLETEKQTPFVLVFGTGWGLHESVMEDMDVILEPIYGPAPWNHLSVRAAGGIILDRLAGLDRPSGS
jgi:hypothetical protein